MNKQRRNEINKAIGMLCEARSILETERDEEQDYRDNIPDSLSDSEKANKADEIIQILEGACNSCEEYESNLADAIAE
jgi:hypothetical protein